MGIVSSRLGVMETHAQFNVPFHKRSFVIEFSAFWMLAIIGAVNTFKLGD
jgi:hypothetical protein